ncbi:MAG: hypothetical protein PW734_05735 [Verrucomicrobium sp.]|nr:hypothetical protein [Verrucomicrobium sp.]
MSPFSVAARAFDLGYRVLCVDLPDFQHLPAPSREKGENLAQMNRRNRHMAGRVAREIRENGARVVFPTGRSHILTHWPGREREKGTYVPLPAALKALGVPVRAAVFPGPAAEESLAKSRTRAQLLSTLEEAEAFPRFRRASAPPAPTRRESRVR